MLIGDVARRTGVSARMLRHYDALGLVRPTGRTHGGYREYTAADLRLILHVEGLRSLGLSLRQIGRALADPGFTPAALVGDLIRESEQRLAREKELLERLRQVGAADPEGWPDVARIVELLRGLGSRDAAKRQQAVLSRESAPVRLLAEALLTEDDPNVAGALRWALARAGADGTALATGLRSGRTATRRRAVQAVAELPGDEATALLTGALADPDAQVRRHAALALGARRIPAAVEPLVATIVDGPNDVEAAEFLGAMAHDPDQAGRILSALTAELESAGDPAARMRLAQALAELPRALTEDLLHRLTEDADRGVALLAKALTTNRGGGGALVRLKGHGAPRRPE